MKVREILEESNEKIDLKAETSASKIKQAVKSKSLYYGGVEFDWTSLQELAYDDLENNDNFTWPGNVELMDLLYDRKSDTFICRLAFKDDGYKYNSITTVKKFNAKKPDVDTISWGSLAEMKKEIKTTWPQAVSIA